MPEVQIPDEYNTFGTVIGVENINGNVDANQAYDLLTRQTIPLVLLGRFVDPNSNLVQSSVEFLCITANNTVKGSRVPEQQTPWKSALASNNTRIVGWIASVITVIMLLI
jgi:hypothetical protein